MLEMLDTVSSALLIIIAFSVLIFVHELGHYLAALVVGVRPERFFIGFDIYGLGIKKEYKGCVYGIGLLPLGGYVKLAGQSDDPREQKSGEGKPDEYGSKPLWAQALIISAGVIMNMVFGYLLLFGAYLHGMPQVPPVAGDIMENSPAQMAGIQSGDRILKVNGQPIESMNKLKEFIVINPRDAFDFELERAGKVLHRRVRGQEGGAGVNEVGIMPPADPVIGLVESDRAASGYDKLFQKHDRIVRVDGREIPEGAGGGDVFLEMIRRQPGKTVPITVLRDGERIESQVPVLGAGMYDFGCRVAVQIEAVVDGSPAAAAGLRAGDRLTGIINRGGKQGILDNGDLSRKIRANAYAPVEVTFKRGAEVRKTTVQPVYRGGDLRVPEGKDTLLGVLVEPVAADKPADGFRITALLEDGPAQGKFTVGDVLLAVNGKPLTDPGADVAAACCQPLGLLVAGRAEPVQIKPNLSRETGQAMIGIVMAAFPEVLRTEIGSEAAKFLEPGDKIVRVQLADGGRQTAVSWVAASGAKRDPYVFPTPASVLASLQAGTLAEVDGFLPLALMQSAGAKKAVGILPAAAMAGEETVRMSLTVYTLLHRLVAGQISTKNMSGPVGIFRYMQKTVESEDPVMKMIFLLALISINLAIFNLLPFPVLDGGHLAFIIVEAVKGSPPGDRLRELLQYFGVVCLLSLMVYVTYNDVARWISDWRLESTVEKAVGKTDKQ